MDIPTLETARLILRAHRAGDLADCTAMWSDPEVVRFIGGRPSTEEEVWSRLLRYLGHWALLGYGYWLIAEKASGRFVGEVGFADFKREIVPRLDAPEIGWALAPWSHGCGYATEAVQAALDWLPAPRTVCMISPENAPSLRVAAKLGYVRFAETTYKGAATVLFERAQPSR